MGELSDLTVLVLKFGFLAVLWIFVLSAVGVMRRDLFANRVGATPAAAASPPSRQVLREQHRESAPARSSRSRRGGPTTLVVTSGRLEGTSVPLADTPITLGRGQDNTLVLNDDFASTRHARFFAADGEWFVEDLGSTNGTYLDRAKVSGPTPAPLGVPIRIGKTVFELRK